MSERLGEIFDHRRPYMDSKLDEIYSQIPDLGCDRCGECCKYLITHTYVEGERINRYIKNKNIDVSHRILAMLGESEESIILLSNGLRCPYYQDGGCAIYPVRPLICRLFGTVEGGLPGPCERGCMPERMLTKQRAKELMEEVRKIDAEWLNQRRAKNNG